MSLSVEAEARNAQADQQQASEAKERPYGFAHSQGSLRKWAIQGVDDTRIRDWKPRISLIESKGKAGCMRSSMASEGATCIAHTDVCCVAERSCSMG
jgi:hypothetical protein